MRRSDPEDQDFVDCKVKVWAMTGKAMLLSSIDDREDQATWVAKSQCAGYHDLDRGDEGTIGIKRWLAEREGLV